MKRSSWPLWLGIGLLSTLALLLLLRAKAPPEAARLLPESDAILYANLRPLRTLARLDLPAANTPTLRRSPDFQAFVDATGIDPAHDLDSVAFALHRMPDPRGPNGAVAYSEVFVGHFQGDRLKRYLAHLSRSVDTYAGHEIFNIPVEGRTLRVTQLKYDTVAASNAPTAEQIHSMLDRSEAAALWTSGSSLLNARYGAVPLLSQAWGIGRIGLPFGENGRLSVFGFALPLPVDTELIASLRYSGALRLRVEEIAPDALAAQHSAESVRSILSVLRGLADAQGPRNPRDAAMRSVLSSASVEQRNQTAVLTATASLDDARLLASPSVDGDVAAEAPAPTGSQPY